MPEPTKASRHCFILSGTAHFLFGPKNREASERVVDLLRNVLIKPATLAGTPAHFFTLMPKVTTEVGGGDVPLELVEVGSVLLGGGDAQLGESNLEQVGLGGGHALLDGAQAVLLQGSRPLRRKERPRRWGATR
jgi:hypothetical protein